MLDIVWFVDSHLVRRLEMVLMMGSSVSNYNLTWIFVRHNNTRDGQATSIWIWVVWGEFFLKHTSVFTVSLHMESSTHRLYFWWFAKVLIAMFIFPSSLFKWIRDSSSLPSTTIFLLDVSATSYFIIRKVHSRSLKFDCVVHLWIV